MQRTYAVPRPVATPAPPTPLTPSRTPPLALSPVVSVGQQCLVYPCPTACVPGLGTFARTLLPTTSLALPVLWTFIKATHTHTRTHSNLSGCQKRSTFSCLRRLTTHGMSPLTARLSLATYSSNGNGNGNLTQFLHTVIFGKTPPSFSPSLSLSPSLSSCLVYSPFRDHFVNLLRSRGRKHSRRTLPRGVPTFLPQTPWKSTQATVQGREGVV